MNPTVDVLKKRVAELQYRIAGLCPNALVNIDDVKSLAAHPASTTHRQLAEQGLETAGVTPDMIRLCIGIEHVDENLAELDPALAASD